MKTENTKAKTLNAGNPANSPLPSIRQAKVTIRSLTKAKTEAETQIARCQRHSASEERMLHRLLKEQVTSENQEYLKKAKKACRLGIKAWKLSIKAYRHDIRDCQAQINAVVKQVPEARKDA